MIPPGSRPHVIERALELAATGQYRARWDVARALEKEGYTIADVSHLEARAISRELTARCRQARMSRDAA